MLVNDNASKPANRGAPESIAGKPAPTDIARPLVGAGLPAMVVNDNACDLDKRGALESIAGKPAPTGIARSLVGAGLPDCQEARGHCVISITRPVIKAIVRPALSQNSFGRRSSAFSSDIEGKPSSFLSSKMVAAAPTESCSEPKRGRSRMPEK
jgi:hypothetical protein